MRASISTCGSGRSSVPIRSPARVSRSCEVGDDQRVRAHVGRDRSALRQHGGGQQRLHQLGAGVAQGARHRRQRAGERLRFGQLLALRLFVGQDRQRRDADDGAVDHVAKTIGAQDDVERLIPGHVPQRDVNRPLDRRIDDDVQAADLGERAEHGAQIGALKIQADRKAGKALRRGRRAAAAVPLHPERPAPAAPARAGRPAAAHLRRHLALRRRGRLRRLQHAASRTPAVASADPAGGSKTTVRSLPFSELSILYGALRVRSIVTRVTSGFLMLRPTRTASTGPAPIGVVPESAEVAFGRSM